jgi:hypothetical protein
MLGRVNKNRYSGCYGFSNIAPIPTLALAIRSTVFLVCLEKFEYQNDRNYLQLKRFHHTILKVRKLHGSKFHKPMPPRNRHRVERDTTIALEVSVTIGECIASSSYIFIKHHHNFDVNCLLMLPHR